MLNLLEGVRLAQEKTRIVLVGSGVSYGVPEPRFLPVDESCPLLPNNPYASSKAAADLLAIQYVLGYQLDVVVARPFNHAGPRQTSNYVLSGLARQVAEVELGIKNRVEVGNLEVTRDFSDVRDVAAAYRLLALHGKPGEVYNVGSGKGVLLRDALETLIAKSNSPIQVHVDPSRLRSVDVPLLVSNPGKLAAATGFSPKFSIEQTLSDMLDYWRDRLATEEQERGH